MECEISKIVNYSQRRCPSLYTLHENTVLINERVISFLIVVMFVSMTLTGLMRLHKTQKWA